MPSIINSDDGVVSGTSGLKTTGGNDGILALQNNGTTNVTVTAAGNMGIGTTSPAQTLEVNKSAAGGGSIDIAQFTAQDTTGTNATNPRVIWSGRNTAGAFNIGAVRGVNTVSNGGDLVFQTTPSLGSLTEQSRITSTGLFQFNSGYGSVATAYGCRAWVNFNGTGTVAIRASGNVTSITDNGTGNYTVNFTTAMPDANYNVVFGGPGIVWGGAYNSPGVVGNDNTSFSTNSFVIRACISGSVYIDPVIVCAAVFR